ncbi:hypothetical protein ACOI93_10865 [Corynebacterium striatum]
MPARIYRQGLFSSLEQTKATMTATVIDACRFVVVGTGNPRSWYRVSG